MKIKLTFLPCDRMTAPSVLKVQVKVGSNPGIFSGFTIWESTQNPICRKHLKFGKIDKSEKLSPKMYFSLSGTPIGAVSRPSRRWRRPWRRSRFSSPDPELNIRRTGSFSWQKRRVFFSVSFSVSVFKIVNLNKSLFLTNRKLLRMYSYSDVHSYQ